MAGSPKDALQVRTEGHDEDETEAHQDEGREVFLRDGRRLIVADEGRDQLVEIRSGSGMLELRVLLTEQGPVLQMESVRLQLKATESVEIESRRVEIKATEQLALEGQDVSVHGDHDVKVDAAGEVRVVGKMIYLN
jgi:phage gp45-like